VKGPAVRGWQIRHPIMANLRALDEIPIADAFRLPFLPPRTPRLLEGDRDLVLLAALPRQYFTDLVLTFPLVTANADGPDRVWNSYWPLRPSFVLFLRNVLMNFGDVRETATEDSIPPGSIKSLRLRTAKEALLTKPNGSTTKLIRGSRAEFSITETDQLGVYQVEYEDQSRRFAVNLFDPLESDLAPANSVTIGSEVIAADDPRKTPLELWKWFVVGGLIVVLVEWWIYNRRVQI